MSQHRTRRPGSTPIPPRFHVCYNATDSEIDPSDPPAYCFVRTTSSASPVFGRALQRRRDGSTRWSVPLMTEPRGTLFRYAGDSKMPQHGWES